MMASMNGTSGGGHKGGLMFLIGGLVTLCVAIGGGIAWLVKSKKDEKAKTKEKKPAKKKEEKKPAETPAAE